MLDNLAFIAKGQSLPNYFNSKQPSKPAESSWANTGKMLVAMVIREEPTVTNFEEEGSVLAVLP